MASLLSQKVRGIKKAQTEGDQREGNHRVGIDNDDTVHFLCNAFHQENTK